LYNFQSSAGVQSQNNETFVTVTRLLVVNVYQCNANAGDQIYSAKDLMKCMGALNG
jgi:hypothetical protein